MDINQLKSFVEVAHQGNLTQAAETLHLSQPAVSAQIKAIERNLDITLFKRNSHGMALTPAGEALLSKAEYVLQKMYELDVFAAKLNKEYVRKLKLGIIDVIDSHKLAKLTELFLAKYPEIRVQLYHRVSGEVLNEVRKKQLDGGFFIGDNPFRNTQSILLEEIKYILIAPKKMAHLVDINDNKSLNQLPWLDMPDHAAGSKIIRSFWKTHKILPKCILANEKLSVNVALCSQGLGLALVPEINAEKALQNNAGIVLFPQLNVIGKLNFLYPNEFEQESITQTLLEIVQIAWANNN